MKSGFRVGSALWVALGLLAVPAISHAQEYDPISEIGGEAIRSISFDLCLPADGHEYEALGKNAIIILTSSTAIAPELPLKSVFVEVDESGYHCNASRVPNCQPKVTGSNKSHSISCPFS